MTAVGDVLIREPLNSRYSKAHEVVVTKIGRKWGWAKPVGGGPDYKFDLETGYEDCGQYMSRHRALTAEQDAEEKRRAALVESLKEYGLEFGYSRGRDITTDQLARVVAALADA